MKYGSITTISSDNPDIEIVEEYRDGNVVVKEQHAHRKRISIDDHEKLIDLLANLIATKSILSKKLTIDITPDGTKHGTVDVTSIYTLLKKE